MASQEELYRTYDMKRGYARVMIGGVPLLGITSIDWTFGISQVPTCTIHLRGAPPANVVFRATVAVDVGFENSGLPQFRGKLYHINAGTDETLLECMGTSFALDVPYHKVVKTFNNITAQQAIVDFMTSAGITDYNVAVPAWTIGTVVLSDDPAKAYVTLEFQTYGEAISTVGEPDGSRWMEMPTGQVIVRPLYPIPGLTYWREYFAMNLSGIAETYPAAVQAQTYLGRPTRPRISNIHGEQQVREVKNQVHVKGVEVTQTNADGTTDPIDIVASASAPSPWVLNPDGSQAYNDELFGHPLIDTVAKAQQVAGDKVTVKNRLNYRLNVDIDADPEIVLGRTVRLVDETYSRFIGQFFVEAYTTSIDVNASGGVSNWSTNLTVIGGADAGGVTNIDPFALFTHKVDLEVIGDRVWAVITLDGRGSSDLDGSVVSWTWTSNNGNVVNGTGSVLYARVDPTAIVGTLDVTLVTVDNVGATDSIMLSIAIDATADDVTLPAFFVAADAYASASPDGGVTWNDQAIADSVISVGYGGDASTPFGAAFYGCQSGAAYHTTDYCATALTLSFTAPGPVVAVGVNFWDRTMAWLLTQQGMLYRSNDNGASWFVWDDLRAVFGKPNIRAAQILTPAQGGVWVVCGDGEGRPLIAFDSVLTHHWGQVALGGDLLADLLANPVATDLYVRQWGIGEGAYNAIILNSATFPTSVYFTDNALGDGSGWKRAPGLPAKTRGMWMDGDYGAASDGVFQFGYDDNVIYLLDINGGVGVVTVAPTALDAGDVGNSATAIGSLIGGIGGAHIICGEGTIDGTLYKTWDRWTDIGKLRPAISFPAAPAGWNAKQMIADSAGAAQLSAARIAIVANYGGATTWDIAYPNSDFTGWTDVDLPASIDHANPRPWCVSKLLWFVTDVGGFPNPRTAGVSQCVTAAARTDDGGATWALTAIGDEDCAVPEIGGLARIAVDAGGRIWGARQIGSTTAHPLRSSIHYSDADGATGTWNLAGTLSQGGARRYPYALLTHPSNQQIIALISSAEDGDDHCITYMTEDRGGSFTERGATVASGDNFAMTTNGNVFRAMMLPNGRLVMVTRWDIATPTKIYTSDDKGAKWVLRYTDAGLGNNMILTGPGSWQQNGNRIVGLRVPLTGGNSADWALVISEDGGTTWIATAIAAAYGTPTNLYDAVYDPVEDAIIVSNGAAAGARVYRYRDTTSAAGTWEDLTSDLANGAAHWEGIALIPRT